MLTFVEAISLAGDRNKQNDDACGFAGNAAWVIDGATDLHDWPYSGAASDASWIAHALSRHLTASLGEADDKALRAAIGQAARRLNSQFSHFEEVGGVEPWELPIASVLAACETTDGVMGVDLGDCRVFALGADGAMFAAGGSTEAADAETQLAAQQTDANKPLLRREATIARLREMRAGLNQAGAHWTFCLNPACAGHARGWSFQVKRPAHVLLTTDGFSALVDRYRAYDAAGLVRAAVDKGLQELGRELRAIETADAGGAKHPRFKASDDATALLLRLT